MGFGMILTFISLVFFRVLKMASDCGCSLVLVLVLVLGLSTTARGSQDEGTTPSIGELGRHAGYYGLPRSHSARMFYVFWESRTSRKDSLVLWLNGGPGCSSMDGLFLENGPVHLADNLSLLLNDYSWDKASNLLYVDQPIGTGFSYSTNPNDTRHDLEAVTDDLYDFLQAFFMGHSRFSKNAFYITGESYAGHYIPALASRIHIGNKAKHGIHINLKGFAIGNGNSNPAVEYNSFLDYAQLMKLINSSVAHKTRQEFLPKCQQLLKSCELSGGNICGNATDSCEPILDRIANISGVDQYDVTKKKRTSFQEPILQKFLNKKLVKDALRVGDREFRLCNRTVLRALGNDMARRYDVKIPRLLEDGIKVLIFVGEFDMVCNWLGTSRWLHAMQWSGQKQFGASPRATFRVDGIKAGELKSYGPLAFLKVHKAGHQVLKGQPKVALHMLREWMNGNLVSH